MQEKYLYEGGGKPSMQALFGAQPGSAQLPGAQPTFVAAESTWEALKACGEVVFDGVNTFSYVARTVDPEASRVHHWVFVPSYNRFDTRRKDQALLDWSDAAVDSYAECSAGFVRVIVVRPEETQIKVSSRTLSSCDFDLI